MPRLKNKNKIPHKLTDIEADEIFTLVAHTHSILAISEIKNDDPILKEMHARYPHLFKPIDNKEYRYNASAYLYDIMYSKEYKDRYAEARRRRLETMQDNITNIDHLRKLTGGEINNATVNLTKLCCDQINKSLAFYIAMSAKQENVNATVEIKL